MLFLILKKYCISLSGTFHCYLFSLEIWCGAREPSSLEIKAICTPYLKTNNPGHYIIAEHKNSGFIIYILSHTLLFFRSEEQTFMASPDRKSDSWGQRELLQAAGIAFPTVSNMHQNIRKKTQMEGWDPALREPETQKADISYSLHQATSQNHTLGQHLESGLELWPSLTEWAPGPKSHWLSVLRGHKAWLTIHLLKLGRGWGRGGFMEALV